MMRGELSLEQLERLAKLAELLDDQIDTDDIPEMTDWSGAVRGLFYRANEQKEVTLMIASDVLAWLETHTAYNETHLAKMNRALRLYVVWQNGVVVRRLRVKSKPDIWVVPRLSR